MIGIGGIGGIITSTSFRQVCYQLYQLFHVFPTRGTLRPDSDLHNQVDAPDYLPGMGTVMAVQGLNILCVSACMFASHRANRAADAGKPIFQDFPSFRYVL